MSAGPFLREWKVTVLSAVKHDYIMRAVAAHPRMTLSVVAEDADQPDWVHERNARLAEEFHVPYLTDVDRALAEFPTDVAVVSPAAERHVSLSLRAVQSGRHLIVDKPLSPSLDDCQRLCDRVAQAGVKSLVWNRNFHPALQQARQQVAEGLLGSLGAVHGDFYFAKDAGPPLGSRPPGAPPVPWLDHQRAAHADGSDGAVGHTPMGELQVEGLYPLAYLRWLTGRKVESVFARTASWFHQLHADHGVEDLASLTLELEGGMTATICLGRIGRASHPDLGEIVWHLMGSRGALVVSEPRPEVAMYHRGQAPEAHRHRRVGHENDRHLLDDLLRAIEEDGETVLDVRGGRDICEVIDAALRSAQTGRVERVAGGR